MSYATYSSNGGLPPVAPNKTVTFRTRTKLDERKNNATIVEKIRLPKGATIRAQEMYGTAISGTDPVPMPFTGNLNLTITQAAADDGQVIIQNPFVSGDVSQDIVIRGDGSLPTIVRSPGEILLDVPLQGDYVLSVRI